MTNEGQVKLFHISTKGKDSSLFIDESDYSKAIDICAIGAYALRIDIIAYCMMSNHVHFAVLTASEKNVNRFIIRFKKCYSKYFNEKHQVEHAFRDVSVLIKEIDSIQYFKNCIAYIMRNPVEAGVARNADQYEWSSYNCYFRNSENNALALPASSYQKRFLMDKLETHTDVTGSKMMITKNGNILPSSFVNHAFVENLYDVSREVMSRFISKVNNSAIEYELAYTGTAFQDSEVIKIASNIARSWYSKELSILDAAERSKMVKILKLKYKANSYQISRVLGLDKRMVDEITGKL